MINQSIEIEPFEVITTVSDTIVIRDSGSAEKTMAPEFPAFSALSALRAVVLVAGKWTYANGEALQAIALTLNSAAQNSLTRPLLLGTVADPAWNWTLGSPIFLGNNGTLTQTPAEGQTVRILGVPVSPTQIYFNPREGILL